MNVMVDRRKKRRFEINLPLILNQPGLPAPLHTHTIDLSTSGFSCAVNQPFSPGDILNALIQLPEGLVAAPPRYISGVAEVTRVSMTGSGFLIGCLLRESTILDMSALPDWARRPFAAAAR